MKKSLLLDKSLDKIDILSIDYETTSLIPLKDSGVWRYAEDSSTNIMCLSLCYSGNTGLETYLWVPLYFEKLIRQTFPKELTAYIFEGLPLITKDEVAFLMSRASIISAANAEFEKVITRYLGETLLGYSPDYTKFRCSLARAASLGLPRDLATLASVLKTPFQKDNKSAMLTLSKLGMPGVVKTKSSEISIRSILE